MFLRVEAWRGHVVQLLNTAHMPDVPSQVKVNLNDTSWEDFCASSPLVTNLYLVQTYLHCLLGNTKQKLKGASHSQDNFD